MCRDTPAPITDTAQAIIFIYPLWPVSSLLDKKMKGVGPNICTVCAVLLKSFFQTFSVLYLVCTTLLNVQAKHGNH